MSRDSMPCSGIFFVSLSLSPDFLLSFFLSFFLGILKDSCCSSINTDVGNDAELVKCVSSAKVVPVKGAVKAVIINSPTALIQGFFGTSRLIIQDSLGGDVGDLGGLWRKWRLRKRNMIKACFCTFCWFSPSFTPSFQRILQSDCD